LLNSELRKIMDPVTSSAKGFFGSLTLSDEQAKEIENFEKSFMKAYCSMYKRN